MIPGSFRHRLREPRSTEGRKELINNKEDTAVVYEPHGRVWLRRNPLERAKRLHQ
jgi:hypothetical protein